MVEPFITVTMNYVSVLQLTRLDDPEPRFCLIKGCEGIYLRNPRRSSKKYAQHRIHGSMNPIRDETILVCLSIPLALVTSTAKCRYLETEQVILIAMKPTRYRKKQLSFTICV